MPWSWVPRNPKFKEEAGQQMLVDHPPSTAVIGADRVAGPMNMLPFNGPIAVCVATTAYGAAILPAASRLPQRPRSSGAARTRRLTRWPSRHDLPLKALGLAHGHRRTDNELRFVRRLIGPRRPTAVRGALVAPCLSAVRRETKTLNRVRADASPGEERDECVSRCDFQSHTIESANMF